MKAENIVVFQVGDDITEIIDFKNRLDLRGIEYEEMDFEMSVPYCIGLKIDLDIKRITEIINRWNAWDMGSKKTINLVKINTGNVIYVR